MTALKVSKINYMYEHLNPRHYDNIGTELLMNEGPWNSIGNGLYYKFMELEKSTFILSNDMYIQSNNDMCVLFWLGEDLQIVLSTNVVR